MRIGTACQIMKPKPRFNRKGETIYEQVDDCKLGTIRVADVKDLYGRQAYSKIREKTIYNLAGLKQQILYMSKQPKQLRMLRMSSDLFPLIDHPNYMHHYTVPELSDLIQKELRFIGDTAKEHGIRLSVHPSQWITLFSLNEEVVKTSIRHLDIWVSIFKMLGHSPKDGVCLVIHTNGKSFDFPEAAKHLTEWIALENDEKQAGFDKTLKICQVNGIRMILDVHHYFCENGVNISLNSEEYYAVLATWLGKGRAKMHISSSRGLENFKEQCAHSDRLSEESMELFWEFAYSFDVMVEAKHKNLASVEFYEFIKERA